MFRRAQSFISRAGFDTAGVALRIGMPIEGFTDPPNGDAKIAQLVSWEPTTFDNWMRVSPKTYPSFLTFSKTPYTSLRSYKAQPFCTRVCRAFAQLISLARPSNQLWKFRRSLVANCRCIWTLSVLPTSALLVPLRIWTRRSPSGVAALPRAKRRKFAPPGKARALNTVPPPPPHISDSPFLATLFTFRAEVSGEILG